MMYTPVNPSFTIHCLKVGFKGVKIILACFRDGTQTCLIIDQNVLFTCFVSILYSLLVILQNHANKCLFQLFKNENRMICQISPRRKHFRYCTNGVLMALFRSCAHLLATRSQNFGMLLFKTIINSNEQLNILTLCMLGRNFSRRHFEIFFLFFTENRI